MREGARARRAWNQLLWALRGLIRPQFFPNLGPMEYWSIWSILNSSLINQLIQFYQSLSALPYWPYWVE